MQQSGATTATEISEQASSHQLRNQVRWKFLNITAIVLALAMPVMGIARGAMGTLPPGTVVILCFGFALYLLVYVTLRTSRTETLAASILLGTLTVQLITLYYLAGGIAAPVTITMPILPVLATFLFGKRFGWWMVAICLSICAVFAVAVYQQWPLQPVAVTGEALIYAKALMLAFTCLLVVIVVWAYGLHNQMLQDALEALATEDALTGLANRRAFERQIARDCIRWSRAPESPLCLIIFDVDHFKQYNDQLGHQAGDDCLQQVAQAAAECVQRETDLVARYGGDEFAVILPDTDIENATAVAQAIRKQVLKLELPHPENDSPVVTVSLGLAKAQLDDNEEVGSSHGDRLVQAADSALYLAKQRGRNCLAIASDTVEAEKSGGLPEQQLIYKR